MTTQSAAPDADRRRQRRRDLAGGRGDGATSYLARDRVVRQLLEPKGGLVNLATATRRNRRGELGASRATSANGP